VRTTKIPLDIQQLKFLSALTGFKLLKGGGPVSNTFVAVQVAGKVNDVKQLSSKISSEIPSIDLLILEDEKGGAVVEKGALLFDKWGLSARES